MMNGLSESLESGEAMSLHEFSQSLRFSSVPDLLGSHAKSLRR